MSTDDQQLDDSYAVNKFTVQFTYLPIREHILLGLKKQWKVGCAAFITTLSLIWLFIEPLSLVPNLNYQQAWIYPAWIGAGLFVGLVAAAIAYLNSCPTGYEEETPDVQRIVRYKRPLWEYRAMKIMLENRIGEHDEKLDKIKNKQLFIEKKSLKVLEYTRWVLDRTQNLINMGETASRVLIEEFPKYLFGEEDVDEIAFRLIQGANLIEQLYGSIYEFEMSSYKTKPPEKLNRVHEIQSEWTYSVRDGIKQLMDFFERMSNFKVGQTNFFQYDIVFEGLENEEEFSSELDAAERYYSSAGDLDDY